MKTNHRERLSTSQAPSDEGGLDAIKRLLLSVAVLFFCNAFMYSAAEVLVDKAVNVYSTAKETRAPTNNSMRDWRIPAGG